MIHTVWNIILPANLSPPVRLGLNDCHRHFPCAYLPHPSIIPRFVSTEIITKLTNLKFQDLKPAILLDDSKRERLLSEEIMAERHAGSKASHQMLLIHLRAWQRSRHWEARTGTTGASSTISQLGYANSRSPKISRMAGDQGSTGDMATWKPGELQTIGIIIFVGWTIYDSHSRISFVDRFLTALQMHVYHCSPSFSLWFSFATFLVL
jgi:hypothetical protein